MRRHLAERVLVAGGGGFLGSPPVPLCVNNFFTGEEDVSQLEPIPQN